MVSLGLTVGKAVRDVQSQMSFIGMTCTVLPKHRHYMNKEQIII